MSKSFKTDPKWLDSSDFKSFAFPNTNNESFLLNVTSANDLTNLIATFKTLPFYISQIIIYKLLKII